MSSEQISTNTNKKGSQSCYPICQEIYSWQSPFIGVCFKGCDFAYNRVNDPKAKDKGYHLCQKYINKIIWKTLKKLDKVDDLQSDKTKLAQGPEDLYKACIEGVRKQRS